MLSTPERQRRLIRSHPPGRVFCSDIRNLGECIREWLAFQPTLPGGTRFHVLRRDGVWHADPYLDPIVIARIIQEKTHAS